MRDCPVTPSAPLNWSALATAIAATAEAPISAQYVFDIPPDIASLPFHSYHATHNPRSEAPFNS